MITTINHLGVPLRNGSLQPKRFSITMIAIQICEGSIGNPQVSRKLPPQFSEIKPTVQNNLILVTIAMKLRRKIVNWSQSR